MVLITTDPIDPHEAYDMIASKSAGSVLIHCKLGIGRLKTMRSIVKSEGCG
jgi:hypothetical protein